MTVPVNNVSRSHMEGATIPAFDPKGDWLIGATPKATSCVSCSPNHLWRALDGDHADEGAGRESQRDASTHPH
jgi:hypothetical protein